MSDATIYHNPKCSKSCRALEILNESSLAIVVVSYLEAPPTAEELDGICTQLGVEPLAITRVKEARFEELKLSVDDDRSRAEWVRFLTENPSLLERPIVRVGTRWIVARPPERVLELIEFSS